MEASWPRTRFALPHGEGTSISSFDFLRLQVLVVVGRTRWERQPLAKQSCRSTVVRLLWFKPLPH